MPFGCAQSPSATRETSSPPKARTPVGTIVGAVFGVVGGLAALVGLAMVIYFLWKRRGGRATKESLAPPGGEVDGGRQEESRPDIPREELVCPDSEATAATREALRHDV